MAHGTPIVPPERITGSLEDWDAAAWSTSDKVDDPEQGGDVTDEDQHEYVSAKAFNGVLVALRDVLQIFKGAVPIDALDVTGTVTAGESVDLPNGASVDGYDATPERRFAIDFFNNDFRLRTFTSAGADAAVVTVDASASPFTSLNTSVSLGLANAELYVGNNAGSPNLFLRKTANGTATAHFQSANVSRQLIQLVATSQDLAIIQRDAGNTEVARTTIDNTDGSWAFPADVGVAGGVVLDTQATVPSGTPAADKATLWVRSDDVAIVTDDAGVDHELVYADAIAVPGLSDVLAAGNETDGTSIAVTNGDALELRDASDVVRGVIDFFGNAFRLRTFTSGGAAAETLTLGATATGAFAVSAGGSEKFRISNDGATFFGLTTGGTEIVYRKPNASTQVLVNLQSGVAGGSGRRWVEWIDTAANNHRWRWDRHNASGTLQDTPIALDWTNGNVVMANSLDVGGDVSVGADDSTTRTISRAGSSGGGLQLQSDSGTVALVGTSTIDAVAITGASGTSGRGVSIAGGNSDTTGSPGGVTLKGGDRGSVGTGANVTINAGDGGSTSGNGGAVVVNSGIPAAGGGGDITLTVPNSVGTNQSGGSVRLKPGNHTGTGVNGVVHINGPLGMSGVTTHTLGNNDNNDIAPSGGGPAAVWVMSPGTSSRITGISTVGLNTGSNRLVLIYNLSTSTSFTLGHQNTGSAATNRIVCPGSTDLTVRPGGSVWLWYQSLSGVARWRVFGTP